MIRSIPAVNEYANPFVQSEWRISPELTIREVLVNRAGNPAPFGDHWTSVFDIFVNDTHIATAGSLRTALGYLHEEYTSTLPF